MPGEIDIPPFEPTRPTVKISTYPSNQPPALSLLNIAATLSPEYLLFVDANVRPLIPSFTKTLLRATGTKEYGNAVLGTGGLMLPNSTTTESYCATDDTAPLLRTKSVHFPSTPFLVAKDSLPDILNGLRTDVPVEMAISLALWTKRGMPTFAIPLGETEAVVDYSCERLRKAIEGEESKYYAAFEMGHRIVDGGSEATEEKRGQVMMLLSGEDELELAHPLACGLAQSLDVRVYLADTDTTAVEQRIFFPPEHSSSSSSAGSNGKKGSWRCHLEVSPLNLGDEADSIPGKIVSEIDRLGQVEVAIYLTGGERAREFSEVLKWVGGTFGIGQGGKRRKSAAEEGEREIIVIGLPKEEVQFSEWLGALPLDALRRQSIYSLHVFAS